MTRLRARPFWTTIAQTLLGSAGVMLLSFVSYRLQFNIAMAVLGDLVVIALLSLGGNFLAAALVSLVAVGALSFFFSPPLFSVHVGTTVDFMALGVFLATALIISRLVSSLRQALERVQAAKEALHQRAGLLDLTHDTIFVRDLNDVIRYWNRGAAELYGWTEQEVLGRITHDVLHTEFPVPLDEIREEVFRTGRWEGELRHSKRDGTRVVVASRWSLQRDERGQPHAILESNNDVTARVSAEAELRESERRHRRIFDTAAVSIWEEDFSQVIAAMDELRAQGVTDFSEYLATHPEFVPHAISLVKIIDVNDATLALVGAESKDELLVSLHKVFVPETHAVFAQELIALAEGKTFFEGEAVLQNLQGDRLTAWFTMAFPPPPDRRDSVLVSIMDLSQRKRAEEALRRSEAYLAEAQRLNHTGSFGWDVTEPKVIWSDETFRIFEYDPAEVEPSVDRAFQRIHPDDRARVRQLLDRAIEQPAEWSLDHRLLMPDGRIKHVHVVAQPVSGPSEKLEFIGAVMDVTAARRAQEELRRSEAYLAEAQRLSHTGSWARNLRQPEKSYWSDEAYRIFAVDRTADPATVNREMRERVHPEDWPRLQEAGQRAIRERSDFDVDYRAILPNGSIRYIHAVGHPVTDSAGKVVELVGTVIDVTERKRSERALRKARERTLQARFAAVLNERTRLAREIHDTLLQGFTGVALKLLAASNRVTAPPESVFALREVVALAQQTLTDARRAVWDLRTPSPAGGDFPAALRAAAEDCVRNTGLALQYSVDGSSQPLDPEVEAVALRVVQESITNVVKHARARTVRVQLSFQSRRVQLVLTDDGQGFVVDPDFGTYGGHWGLLGMRERISQVRGKLSVRSALGKGTEILVLLPYIAPEEAIPPYRPGEPTLRAEDGLEPGPLEEASRRV